MYRFKGELLTVYDKDCYAYYNYLNFLDDISPEINEHSRSRVVDYVGKGYTDAVEYISEVYGRSICNGMIDYVKQNAFYQEVQKGCDVTSSSVNKYITDVCGTRIRAIVDEVESANPDAPRFENTRDDDRIVYVLTPNGGEFHGDVCHNYMKTIKEDGMCHSCDYDVDTDGVYEDNCDDNILLKSKKRKYIP